MALKVRCPKCRSEIADPPDLRAVSCPCGALFDGRSAPLAYWIGAGVLCALVLVALWITAWQNRARKLAGRHGEEIAGPSARPLLNLAAERRDAAVDEYFERFAKLHPVEPADVELPADAPPGLQERTMQAAARHGVRIRFFMGESKRMTLRLQSRQGILVEHFELHRIPGLDLGVRNAKGEPVVEYRNLEKGDLRRWHELEIRCVERSDAELVLDLELKPGSPCFGPGTYAVRPGLRVDLAGNRTVSVVRHDSEQTVQVEVREGDERRAATLAPPRSDQTIGSTRLRVRTMSEGGRGLLIDAP